MATICFDLQRLDHDYVAIRHIKHGTSEYNCHRALHFTNETNGRKKSCWLHDKKYRYIWVLIGYYKYEYEEICFVCNDKIWTNRAKRYYENGIISGSKSYSNFRIVKIPFEKIDHYVCINGWTLPQYVINDLGDNYVLYSPIEEGEIRNYTEKIKLKRTIKK